MSEVNDLRVTGSEQDLCEWEQFFRELDARGLITLAEISKNYPNRGASQLARKYFKMKLNP